jgi:hypothetical protein
VVNDQATIFYWEVIGSNFGSSKGTIQLAGITVPASAITQWTTTSIRFLPTVPYTWGPMTTTLSITTSSGLNVKNYVGIVPSVRTRIFGQCTYYVAYTRLNIGKQPSPSAYPTGSEPNAAPAPGKAPQGWTYITGDYVPQTGDQLEWNGHHTAIISKVDPFTKNGNITSWHVTIQEMNADCKNTLQLKASDFQIQNVNGKNQIKQAIQSNASKLGPPRSFYR